MRRLDDRPFCRLTGHFFDRFFDVAFLPDAASDSIRRIVLGVLAFLLTSGLLLVRMYLTKYVQLAALDMPEPYAEALLGDDALAIGLPMIVLAFAASSLVGDTLFPDETDFRTLMPLPVTARTIFGTKLAALTLFAGVFIVGAHVAMVPFLVLISVGPWAEHHVLSRVAAYLAASMSASTLVVVGMTALNGLLVMGLPPRRNIGAFLVRQALRQPWRSLVVIGIMTAVTGALRSNRIKRWQHTPLLFEDQAPELLQRLGLTAK